MIERFPGDRRASVQRCLRCYGYGVPRLRRALWSAENAATLIYEGELYPYHKVASEIRSNEMHVHGLPWPVEVLQQLGEAQVTMRVTLSYFIEPSPGRIGWTRKHRYQSHGLRFDVNRPLEKMRTRYGSGYLAPNGKTQISGLTMWPRVVIGQSATRGGAVGPFIPIGGSAMRRTWPPAT